MKGDEPEPLPAAASMQDGVEVWDLRQRPTPDEVGIGGGENTSVYEVDEPRTVRLRLAGEVAVELPTRYVVFSTLPSPDERLTSVDVKTDTMSLDATVSAFESVLKQLNLPTMKAAAFQRAADKASGTAWVRTDRVSDGFGDLDLGVVARYSPNSGRGHVALGGGWLKDD